MYEIMHVQSVDRWCVGADVKVMRALCAENDEYR
jgi:hypothetical protein